MVYVIGSADNEIKTLPITLLSNMSSELFPNNTATDFTNLLPEMIKRGNSIDSMGLRVKSIFVSKYSEINDDGKRRKHYEPMLIMINCIEGQLVNSQTIPVLAIANVREASKEAWRYPQAKYCQVSLSDRPIMTVTLAAINRLRIQLITHSGEVYPLWNNNLVVPTILEIELISMEGVNNRDYTITCMSHGSNMAYYGQNSLTAFRSTLGRYVNMETWEVGMQSISMPPFLTKGDLLTFWWNYEDTRKMPDESSETWRKVEIIFGEKYVKREDIFDELTRQLSLNAFVQGEGGEKIEFSQSDEGSWEFKNNVINTNVHIKLNPPMAAILDFPEYDLLRPNTPEGKHVSTVSPQCSPDDLIQPPEIAFMYSTLASDNIVGNQRVNLLAIVPMNIFLNQNLPNRGATIYEPKNVIFHRVKPGSIQSITFELKRADGKDFILLPTLKQQYNESSGGCVVTLHFRPPNSEVRKRRIERSVGDDSGSSNKKYKYKANYILK